MIGQVSKRIIIIPLMVIILLSSCKEKKTGFCIPEFEIVGKAIMYEVSGEDELVPIAIPATPLEITDSTIVMAGYLDNSLIHEYNKETGKYIKSCIPRGNGPSEIEYFGTFTKNKNGWIAADDETLRIKKYDYEFKHKGNYDILKDGFLFLTGSFLLPDGRMLAAGLRDDAPISEHGTEGLRILGDKCSGNMITETPVDNIIEDNNLYSRKRFAFNSNLTKLACGTLEGGVLETFNVDGNNLEPRASCLLFPYNVVEQNGMKRRAIDSKIGFSSIIADNNKIVAALSGDKNPASPTDITVWDWDCKPLRKYTTNAVILTMAFSPDDPDSVYAVVVEDKGDPKIVTYRCPGLSECK